MSIYYTIYKTTNKITGEFYIGAHKCKYPNDSYYGSGKLLKEAIEFYGKSSFEKEVLFICNSEEEMYEMEELIVDIDFIMRDDTYNLFTGGRGSSLLGRIISDNNLGIHKLTFEERSNISKFVQNSRDKEERRKACSKGGKIGSRVGIERKTGIFGLSKEERTKNARNAALSLIENGKGFADKELQSLLGKRGGKKAKGSFWYTDGINTFKYTKEMHEKYSFFDFLNDNPQYYRGRSNCNPTFDPKKRNTGKRWVTNGKINKLVIDINLFLEENKDFYPGKTHHKKR